MAAGVYNADFDVAATRTVHRLRPADLWRPPDVLNSARVRVLAVRHERQERRMAVLLLGETPRDREQERLPGSTLSRSVASPSHLSGLGDGRLVGVAFVAGVQLHPVPSTAVVGKPVSKIRRHPALEALTRWFSRASVVHDSPSPLPALLALGDGTSSKIIPSISRAWPSDASCSTRPHRRNGAEARRAPSSPAVVLVRRPFPPSD